MAAYAKATFGLYQGNKEKVHIQFPNSMCGVFIDRFGKDLIIMPDGEGYFKTSFEVAISNQFLGWIFSLGSGVQITGPESVVHLMQEETKRLMSQYL